MFHLHNKEREFSDGMRFWSINEISKFPALEIEYSAQKVDLCSFLFSLSRFLMYPRSEQYLANAVFETFPHWFGDKAI